MDKERTPVKDLPLVEQEIKVQPIRNGWLVKSSEGWFQFPDAKGMLGHVEQIAKARRG